MKDAATRKAKDSRPERSAGSGLSKMFALGAQDWGIKDSSLKAMLVVPFVIAASGAVAALMGKPAYKMLTGEDKIAETLQVICWIISFVLTILIIKKSARANEKGVAVLFGILAVGIIFMIGEEISWGQRLFGWETPESYASINKQEETNLHNIHGVGFTFKWLHMIVGGYGGLLPLVLLFTSVLQEHRKFLSRIVPHFTLIPFFLMPFFWRLYRNLFDAPKDFYFVVSEYSEVMELVLASGFVFFFLFQKRQFDSQPTVSDGRL